MGAAYIPFRQHYNITHLVNCAKEAQEPVVNSEGMEIKKCPWRDGENQGKSEQKNGFKNVIAACEFIDEALKSEKKVMVHCIQGVSRSSSIVVCYLMYKKGMPVDEAKILIKEKHPTMNTVRFNEMLIGFQYYLLGLEKYL